MKLEQAIEKTVADFLLAFKAVGLFILLIALPLFGIQWSAIEINSLFWLLIIPYFFIFVLILNLDNAHHRKCEEVGK